MTDDLAEADIVELVVEAMVNRPPMERDEYRYADWIRDTKLPVKPDDFHHEARREFAIEWLDARRAEARAAIAVVNRLGQPTDERRDLTASQIAQVRREALEEAAKLVDRQAILLTQDRAFRDVTCRNIAKAIRALIDKPEGGVE